MKKHKIKREELKKMNVKEICQLNDDECKEIEDLYEKKIALENLTKIIDLSNPAIYEKMTTEYGSTIHKFNSWWNKMSKKYDFTGENFWVDFENKKIMLNVN